MALSNAERQKRFRERRNSLAQAMQVGAYYDIDKKPCEFARSVLAVVLAVTAQSSECQADSGFNDDDRVNLTIEADDVAPETLAALATQINAQWLNVATMELWKEGEPIKLEVSVRAVVDKRKRNAMAKKLEREAEYDDDE